MTNSSDKNKVIANFFELSEYYATSKWVKSGTIENLKWVITNIPLPLANLIYDDNLKYDHQPQDIERIKSIFKNHGVNSYTWWTDNAMVGKTLSENGFINDFEWPGMLIAVNDIHTTPDESGNVDIIKVDDKKTLEFWVDTLIKGYNFNAEIKDHLINLFDDLGYNQPVQNYLAMKDNLPVGTSQLFYDHDTVGLYFVSVIKEYRCMGIGTCISGSMLDVVKTNDFKDVVLESSPLGYNIYKKLGFKKVCGLKPFIYNNSFQKSKINIRNSTFK